MDTLDYIDFTQASNAIPFRPHVATIWRWARQGVKVRGKDVRIRLRCVRAGGRLLTTKPWLDQFMADLATADEAHFAPQASARNLGASKSFRSAEKRRKAAEAARGRMGF